MPISINITFYCVFLFPKRIYTIFKNGILIPKALWKTSTGVEQTYLSQGTPLTDPDVRLSRIRLFIWLIVCLISVYLTLFSLKSVSSSCQSLCIGQVSFSDIATCSSLSSSSITHLQRYYGTIRLPIFLLSLFLLLTRHTLLLFLKLRKYRFSPVDVQSLYYMNRSFRRRGAV